VILGLARRLKKAGVLGINRRNAAYVLPYNPRRFYPQVDDKLRTKRLAEQAGIAVPKLYAVVEIPRQVHALPDDLAPYPEFVIKPARGSGGEGILVVVGRSGGLYRRVDGSLLTRADLVFHVQNVLSGIFSLGGQPDKALVEARVHFDPVFERITHQGVPDIRIIVFLGVPVMAMVRLPTRMSKGRANLHMGAIGAGIDIATGTTLTAVLQNSIVGEHPDTGQPVAGLSIPNWNTLLALAAGSSALTGLGYQGIDIVIDRDLGPLILELNARPGLNIQIANGEGLLGRLREIEREADLGAPTAARVAWVRERFGRFVARAEP